MTIEYHPGSSKSRKRSLARQFVAFSNKPPQTFGELCRRDLSESPTVEFDNPLPRGRKFYLASPMRLYGSQPYEAAIRFARTLAPDTDDTSALYYNDLHWICSFPIGLSRCNALIALAHSDRTLSAGAHAELIWAHQHGLPIAILTWTQNDPGSLYLHTSGKVEPIRHGWTLRHSAYFEPNNDPFSPWKRSTLRERPSPSHVPKGRSPLSSGAKLFRLAKASIGVPAIEKAAARFRSGL